MNAVNSPVTSATRLRALPHPSITTGPKDPGNPAENSLITRLREHDEESFQLVVRRYGPRMLAAARRILRDESDAQDALQDAFVSVFRAIDRFDERSNLATWLHRIAVNAALMKLRASKRRREVAIEELAPASDDQDASCATLADVSTVCAETMMLQSERKRWVRNCIDSLPSRYRVVLLLRDVEELDTADTARALGISENAVKIRLHRARHALADTLRQRLGASGLVETSVA